MKMPNRFKISIAALFLAALMVGVSQAAPANPAPAQRVSQPQTLDRIVAVVNDGVITQNQLNARVRSATMQLHRQKVQLPPPEIVRQQVLDQMITERAQVQTAKEAGIQVDDSDLEQALVRVAANQKMTPQQMRQTVEKDGIAWPDFREEIRSQMMIARVREREVDARVNVSPGEVDNFLANQSATGGSEEVGRAHV